MEKKRTKTKKRETCKFNILKYNNNDCNMCACLDRDKWYCKKICKFYEPKDKVNIGVSNGM